MTINASRGFPGCIGSCNCQQWTRGNCSIALAGKFKGNEKKPTVVLEAIEDGELCTWGTFFGSPGISNYMKLLDQLTIVQDILNGEMLPDFEFEINGRRRNLPYYLADGIYPLWEIFVTKMAEAMLQKHRRFANAQEAFCKDVGRAFAPCITMEDFEATL